MTSPIWHHVKLLKVISGSEVQLYSVRHFYTGLQIGEDAKKLLGIEVTTEELPLATAVSRGQLLEDGLRRLAEGQEKASRKRKG